MSNVSEELLQEWKRAGYHSNGKPGKSAFGEGGIALSQLDGPFERDFHAMRKRLGELEDQLTKSLLVKPTLKPLTAVPLDEAVLAALEEPCKVAELEERLEERLSKLSWLISVSTWFGDVYKRFKQVSGGLVGLK